MAASKRSSRLRLEKLAPAKRLEDLDWLHRFIWKHHTTPKQVLPTRADLKNPSYVQYRAWLSDEAVGTSCYEIRTPFLVETIRTVIHPDYRGEGLGSELSLLMEKEIRKAGFKKIRTTIYVDNHKMIAIKLAQGFRIEGFHPEHDAPGLDEYSLGKLLR